MIVVRITTLGEKSNDEAFIRRVVARSHFDVRFSHTDFGEEVESVVIFEVPDEDDARAAITMVGSSDHSRMSVAKKVESACLVAAETD